MKIGTPPFDTSVFVASPSLSTSLFKGRSSFDGEADPGRAQIFLEQIADLWTRRKLLVFMIKVVEDRTRSIIDFLLAEDAEVARGLAVKEYGQAARIARIDTDKWRALMRIENEIRVRARNLNPLTQLDQCADLYHRFESALQALYAVCDACGDVLGTREGRPLTPDEAQALRRRYCRGGKCGSRARTRTHREKHPEHKTRRR